VWGWGFGLNPTSSQEETMPKKKRKKKVGYESDSEAIDYLKGVEPGAWKSKYHVGLMLSVATPSDEGKLQVHRENLGHGKHSVVVSTSENEAKDILNRQRENVASNRKQHGYWNPAIQEGQYDYDGGKVNDARDGD
jgi:hypothetical protein